MTDADIRQAVLQAQQRIELSTVNSLATMSKMAELMEWKTVKDVPISYMEVYTRLREIEKTILPQLRAALERDRTS